MLRDKRDLMYDQLLLITKAMTRKFEAEAIKSGYNRSEYIIIRDIIDHPHTTQLKVCERTGLKKSAVSKSLIRLLETQTVIKTTCPNDRREINLLVENPEVLKTFCKAELLKNMFTMCESKQNELDAISKHLEMLIDLLDET